MRVIMGVLALAVGACNGEAARERVAAPPAETSAVDVPAAGGATPIQASMMAIPSEPDALKRLEAMGYTVHQEENHLHAPGVKGCPAMAEGPVM